jgi:predicted O-methyltransferase YrrM
MWAKLEMAQKRQSLIRELLGGVYDYYRKPELRQSWGGPFNGQAGRAKIFESIAQIQKPRLIVETGTFRGTTTEKLAEVGVPVVTIEAGHRNYAYARVRLRKFSNVRLCFGDSRQQLREVFRAMGPAQRPGQLFAYLDAHWNADLPLAEEIDIVFRWDPGAIIMIDDFRVPDDPGYGYDDYGAGRSLTSEYLEPANKAFNFARFFPSLPSSEESGARRGCVVLASERRWKGPLMSTGMLKQN